MLAGRRKGGLLGGKIRFSLCPLDPLLQPGSQTSTAGKTTEEVVRQLTETQKLCAPIAMC